MTILTAIFLGFLFSGSIIAFLLGNVDKVIIQKFRDSNNKSTRVLNESHKEFDKSFTKKFLENDDDIKLYLSENKYLNYEKDFPIFEMIKRISKAGWNTEIKLYSKYKYGAFSFYLVCDDIELQKKIYTIIHNYEEYYDVKKLNEN